MTFVLFCSIQKSGSAAGPSTGCDTHTNQQRLTLRLRVSLTANESGLTPRAAEGCLHYVSLDRTILLVEPCAAMKRFIPLAPHGQNAR